jgi:large subunit ribosomal protein L10
MPLTRAKKQELLEGYEEDFKSTPHAFVLSYKGAKVPQVTELRARIRSKGGKYVVVKNTLALRAVKGGPLEALGEHFTGETAVAYSQNDPVALAKVLTDFIKEAPAFQFKGALLDGIAVPTAEIQSIASLPSREQLIAKILFLLQSPITRFARVLAAVPQSFVSVLDQVRIKKENA